MSGTSADGVDVAITQISGRGLDMTAKLILHHHRSYEPTLKAAIFSLRESGHAELSELARIGREISLTYAIAVNEALVAAGVKPSDLAAVAAHGQTLYHNPPDTIQWLDPALIAAEVGCPVVSDFRRADCAAGGQGAPLVPFADYILFRHPTKNRVLLNIGGIANVTWLKAGGTLDDVIAFDTGPGNCISDYLCRKFDPTGPGYDEAGRIAQVGTVASDLLQRLKQHPYFKQTPPKSTDIPTMIEVFESAWHQLAAGDALVGLRYTIPVERLLATANALCVWSIVRSIEPGSEVIISGGGVRNPSLMEGLRQSLSLVATDEIGVPSDAKEALAFALLGAATIDGVPSNVPSATGARRAVVLGSITPRP